MPIQASRDNAGMTGKANLALTLSFDYRFLPMLGFRGISTAVVAALFGAAPLHARVAPLRDPVLIRIGLICRWDNGCIGRQLTAMDKALTFVRTKSPPPSRVQACNRNASRGGERVDWIGFNNCIRNKKIGR